MRTFVCFLALAACAAAAPAGLLLVEPLVRPEPVPILKQINQVNDDGSYTFGFEAGDGSFRVETKSITGEIKGKYGYIDEFGVQQIVDYISGKQLGFQPSGMAPTPIVLRSSPEQRALDFEYSSVDDDEDGMPDYRPAYKTAYQPAPSKSYPKEHGNYPQAAPPKKYDSYSEPAPVQVVPVVEPVPIIEPVRVVQPVVRVEPIVRVVEPVFQPQQVVVQQPLRFSTFEPQFEQQRVPVAVANPDAQFFEDLANQSVDANQDGQPDVLVGPAVVPVAPLVPVVQQQVFREVIPASGPFTAFRRI